MYTNKKVIYGEIIKCINFECEYDHDSRLTHIFKE